MTHALRLTTHVLRASPPLSIPISAFYTRHLINASPHTRVTSQVIVDFLEIENFTWLVVLAVGGIICGEL
jgi:hypothetical protein